MYRIVSGDTSLPVGEPTPERLEEFAFWLSGVWDMVDTERTASEARGGTFRDPEHMRTVNAWHALRGAVMAWKNTRPRANGTNPQREFQINLVGQIIGAAAAIRRATMGGHPADGDMMTRLNTDYTTAVLVLAKYTGADMEAIKAAGENQYAICDAARVQS